MLIIFLTIITLLSIVYSIFVTRRALVLYDMLSNAEELLHEESDVAIKALDAVNKVQTIINTISKYPVADNDPHVQLIVKNIIAAREELKLFTSRYTIDNSDDVK